MTTLPTAKPQIVRDPRIQGGEPTLRGSRTTVASVVISAREWGTVEGVLRDYPHLTDADVAAALAFYAQHPEAVDPYITEAMEGG